MKTETKTKPFTKAKTKTEEDEAPYVERRIKEHDVAILGHLGYKGKLPDGLVETYQTFKKLKGVMLQGPLSSEGWATVVMLYRLGDSD